jgi:hypothetical protein
MQPLHGLRIVCHALSAVDLLTSPIAVQGIEGVAPNGREKWKVLWEMAVNDILALIKKYQDPRLAELTPTFIIIVSGGGKGCAYERWERSRLKKNGP